MGIMSPFQKLCSDAQVKVFGKCCQLKPGGDSSSSLDSSMTSTSDVKDQCPKYQVRSLVSFIYLFESIFEYLQCVVYHPRDWDTTGTSPYPSGACSVTGETDN